MVPTILKKYTKNHQTRVFLLVMMILKNWLNAIKYKSRVPALVCDWHGHHWEKYSNLIFTFFISRWKKKTKIWNIMIDTRTYVQKEEFLLTHVLWYFYVYTYDCVCIICVCTYACVCTCNCGVYMFVWVHLYDWLRAC